jgi:hypothetical protein
MGLLASFLENRKSGYARANSANLEPSQEQNSRDSQLSQAHISKLEIATERKFAAFAEFAGAYRENRNCESAAILPLDARRANVERLRDEMARENERRREWWRRPVPDWPNRIEIRSAMTGEATVIPLRGRRGK